MYCMNIVLVGDDDRVLAEVRREAANNSVTIDAEFADLPTALNSDELKSDKPWLFIVHVGSSSALSQLKSLSGTMVGRPIIALVDADRDATMAVKAMRAGALQVALLPLQRGDFGAALDCIAIQFGLAPGRAKTIAVAGASGGCGTTTIAVNLADSLAFVKKLKCILMELSLRMGVLANYLDVQPRFTTSDLLFDEEVDGGTVGQGLTEIAENFLILPGPYESIEPGHIKPENVLRLIELASRLADVVVLDVPCTFDEQYFKLLAAADSVVLVTQQTVPSIRGAQLVCEALPDAPTLILINRYDRKLAGLSAERLGELLKCPGLATVANDAAVGVAGDQGKLLRLHAPRSRALADIVKLADTLAPQRNDAKGQPQESSLLGRLGRALSLAKV